MTFIVSVIGFDDDELEVYNVRFRANSDNARGIILEHVSYILDKFGVTTRIISQILSPRDIFLETQSEDDEETL
jgi:hypothetical protein